MSDFDWTSPGSMLTCCRVGVDDHCIMSSCHHHDQSGLNDNMQSMWMITCKTIIEDQDDAGDEDADDYRVADNDWTSLVAFG